MKRLVFALTVLCIILSLNGLVYAQEFTKESIQGKYALNSSAGSKAIAIGVASADGNGSMTGSFIQRVGNKQRLTYEGVFTYTVNADGTGSMTGTADDGDTGTADFVIMQAEVVNGIKLATEIFSVRDIGLLGNPATATLKRLPD